MSLEIGFSNKKNKIKKLKDSTANQKFTISKQKADNVIINNSLPRTPSTIQKNIQDFSIDWLPMESVFGYYSQTKLFKGWEIVFERLDERFIPFINVDVLYRRIVKEGEEVPEEGLIFSISETKNYHYFEVEEIPNIAEHSKTRRIELHACFYMRGKFSSKDANGNYLPAFTAEDTLPDYYEAKLFVTIPNPQKHF